MTEEEVEELFKSTIDTGNNEIDYRGAFAIGCRDPLPQIPLFGGGASMALGDI